ncbi:hypothetical protein [Ruminiclostridium josui]|uniref:hypothetical protein n=1 Tax=Ruminiclostridium josui TaxID=1499 RepID=UPI000A92B275|nr:hypothetical protein [Ruminiclostridium josui]
MKTAKLKKKITFSLIIIMTCFTLLNYANGYIHIKDDFGKIYVKIKEKEMKYMYGELTSQGDRYTGGLNDLSGDSVAYDLNSTYDDKTLTV